MDAIGIILLAAGASTRLGQPKQQLVYQGQTLLQHALTAARESGSQPIVVVLSNQSKIINPLEDDTGLTMVQNPDWEEGMASSIRCGLAGILEIYPGLAGVILLVCDQPFVTGELLRRLVARKAETQKPIVACSYQNTLGTPVLFDKTFFPDLLALNGQQGAKKLVYQHPDKVAAVDFPLGYIDIDTPADYAALQQKDKFGSERNS